MLDYRGFATSIFGGIADKYEAYFGIVKNALPKADIRIPYRTYLSVILMIGVFSYALSLAGLSIALTMIELTLLNRVIYMMFVPILVAICVFTFLLFYPMQKMLTRRKNIETNLPFVLTHMGAIAESGIPPYVIFKLISEFEEYGEVSMEMRKIVRNIDVFGLDPLTSVKQVAEKTPSESLKQILFGFVSTTEAGGNVKTFLKTAGEQALFDWRMKREKFLQQLSAYAEFYTGLLIAAPLFIISLFAVMNMIQSDIAGFSILDLMKMSIYLVVPSLNTGFLFFLKGVEMEM